MRKSTSGFTVIELIVIIVVIGIIAAIAIVSYNGIQQAALNEQRSAELLGWKTSFEKYKAANGQYPVMANGGYCLGTGFPEGRCRNYTSTTTNVYYESNSTALMLALTPYDPPLAGTRAPVKDISVGPYAVYSSTTIQLIASLTGVDESDCPEGAAKTYQDSPANTRMTCAFTLTR
jgi:Tfp pilus assembly protein PilE